jgi:hypothetical protein
MAKKAKKAKVAEKPTKKAVKKPKTFASFADWWDKVAQKKVDKIERNWISINVLMTQMMKAAVIVGTLIN